MKLNHLMNEKPITIAQHVANKSFSIQFDIIVDTIN